ncbi:MAG: phosphoglycerate dehydrogenase [Roseitalea sp.]|jgi:D-3-phosphoglycerate dehydrogenase|nr:phosphoglycerate dehydrogenase [Roseitalea sp.]MBO6720437.1 phosphoglycerate dehydrogenase [Roseitalea sp.]MBO6742797.1 phosphoglycerate dehydrogenase [Roseitalea sp.]
MDRVLITPRSLTGTPPPALEPLREAGFELVFSTPGQMPNEAELLQLVPGSVGWLAGIEPVSPAVLAAADRLRVISRNGSGVDNLPLDECRRRGIAVERAMGANAVGVAELTLALMLAACRHIPETAHGLRDGGWPRIRGREIDGATVGIVGMGAIGRRVGTMVMAMGATVLAHDPAQPVLSDCGGKVRYVPLAELFGNADIVTFHCPMTDDGAPLLDAERTTTMPDGAIVVNTARAGLVDETALLAALDGGRVQTYATDVFAEEPPRDRTLAAHPRVIATSHIGGLTEGSVARATESAVANLLKVLVTRDATV